MKKNFDNILLFGIACLIFSLPIGAADFNVTKFKSNLEQLQKSKKFRNVELGIAIATLPLGKIVYQQNETRHFMPASTLKLLLSAAVLNDYDWHKSFEVPIGYAGAIEAGILFGNVYLKGIGAPTVLLDSLRQAVKRIKQQGIQEIQGNIVYDVSAFQTQTPRYPPFARDRWAPGGALVLNSNRIKLELVSKTNPVEIRKVPHTAYAEVKAALKYEDSHRPSSPDMRYQQLAHGDKYTVKGTVTRWTERINYLAVGATRPGLYFATVFQELLAEEGIRFTGKIEKGTVPGKMCLFTLVGSPPLKRLLLEMNTTSDNIIAENLFWKIGLDRIGAPSDAKKAGAALKQFIQTVTPADGFVCADGSGLSPRNRISPAIFIKLLIHFANRKPELQTILPEEPGSTAKWEILGKSGTLSARGLNALAGYIKPRGASKAAFAFVIFGYRHPNPGKLWSGTLTHPVVKVLLAGIEMQ